MKTKSTARPVRRRKGKTFQQAKMDMLRQQLQQRDDRIGELKAQIATMDSQRDALLTVVADLQRQLRRTTDIPF